MEVTNFAMQANIPFNFTQSMASFSSSWQPPVTSRPYRVNLPEAKQVDAILDQYLVAGLIQHSTSPYSSPLVVIPKKSGGVRTTVNYRKLNKLCALSQLPIPRVDDTLDKLLKGRIYSIFDMKSSFHQITVHRDTIPLTAFVTSFGLFAWLKMPQGSSAASGWFCKVVKEVIKNLRGVASYLDDLIVFDVTPATHVGTMRALFERLRAHNLKLTPPKATIGATEADFLGHTISPDGVRPNGAKVSALTKMPMPKDVKQLRSVLGGLSYYRKFLPNMAKRIRPLTTLLKKQEKFIFTPSMEQAVRVLLAELANPPVLVYPDWDAFQTARDLFIFTVMLVAMGLVGLSNKNSQMVPLAQLSSSVGLLRTQNVTGFPSISRRVASCGVSSAFAVTCGRWLEFLTAYNYTLEYRKGSANGNADFLSRLPVAAAECDCSGRSRLTPAEDEEAVFLIRSCGLTLSGDRAADRFSRRADTYAVTAAEFTAEGAADILVNRYIPLWGCSLSLLSDNGSQFCSKLSQAVYARLAIRKVATSSYHPNGNGGVERVNHTMAQMLAMVVNERQDDWDIHLPHVAFAYNNSVSAATGLAPNEVRLTNIAKQIAVIVRCAFGPLPGNWRVLKVRELCLRATRLFPVQHGTVAPPTLLYLWAPSSGTRHEMDSGGWARFLDHLCRPTSTSSSSWSILDLSSSPFPMFAFLP
ncbi:unnamed protein product [Ectocarpus sp. CCAP 1310/34]|nr:unnamed protein product [Ectocarpus sp. CCAP 1310/34]